MSSVAQLSPGLTAWNLVPETPTTFEAPFPGNMATAGIQQQQVGGSDAASPQRYRWPDSFRKPPTREGNMSVILAHSNDLLQAAFAQLSADMESIKAEYVLRNEPAIAHFFSTHRAAAPFLSRALPELKQSFGDDVVLNLEALTDDDDSTTLYAIAVWRGSAERADAALEDFDGRWWLNQTPQSGVTFTYELA
jgi:hypothetical protein